jgi:hypothetical protein
MKFIKYLLNFAGVCLMIRFVFLSYALIVRFPDCDSVMNLIWNRIVELIPIMIVYLILITGVNYVAERKIKKKELSKEFSLLFLINLLLIILAIIYYSYEFYTHCGEIS